MELVRVPLLTVLLTIPLQDCKGSRILAAVSYNSKSHFAVIESLMKGLASRGHEVYVIGFYPQETTLPNYTDISVNGSIPEVLNSFTYDFVQNMGFINILHFIWHKNLDMCQIVLQHPKVQNLLKSDQKFDLIVTHLFGVDCFLGLSHYYKAPYISVVTSVNVPWGNDRIGNPDHPAYIPNYFVPFTNQMSFVQRLVNTFLNEILKIGHYYLIETRTDEFARKYIDINMPPINDLKKNTSIILVNSHPVLNGPRPTLPNFIEIGGIHIGNKGELPQELEKFINGAKEGIIYFSLGSLVRSNSFPKEKIKMFMDAFAELPQKVLWKIENIEGLPKNVMTSKWFPQNEILSHPKTLAFISHGGLLSTQEAVYHGVPMIGIPLFADQSLNVEIGVSKGIAIRLDVKTLTKELLLEVINRIITDNSYRENAKKLSRLFLDRPQTPLQTAIYWTEYVIRHGGAPHLRSAAVELAWYQYLLLDVISVLLIVIMLLYLLSYYCLKVIFITSCTYFKPVMTNYNKRSN